MTLDDELAILGSCEHPIPASERSKWIYDTAVEMRTYRQEVPSAMSDPAALSGIEKGLALGATVENDTGNGS